jgi:hypothetical protein
VTTALTNVVAHTESPVELDAADWFDLDGLEMFDVTGMSEAEQDELLSMLFGKTSTLFHTHIAFKAQ